MTRGDLTGAVLAGGASHRMGRDKATLVVDGEDLWQRQVRMLQDAGAATVGVVRRPDQPALPLPPEVPLWQDAVAGIGPLAGVHAALAACSTGWLAVVATDMPDIDSGWFHWLRDYCRADCGAMARHPSGLFEPLAAIYPRVALAEATRRLAAAPHSLQDLAATLLGRGQLVSVPLPPGQAWRVVSWNTPEEAATSPKGKRP